MSGSKLLEQAIVDAQALRDSAYKSAQAALVEKFAPQIKEAVQHPNADRLRVCQVDVGQDSLLNIVCGAPNARVGIKVPCALVGAQRLVGPVRQRLGQHHPSDNGHLSEWPGRHVWV